jgi:hypothetical protein
MEKREAGVSRAGGVRKTNCAPNLKTQKTPDPGAMGRGFHGAFVTLVQGRSFTKGGQQGGNLPSTGLVENN